MLVKVLVPMLVACLSSLDNTLLTACSELLVILRSAMDLRLIVVVVMCNAALRSSHYMVYTPSFECTM